MLKSLAERFWAKVYKTEGCWFWLAGHNEHGYGVFMLPPIKKAHRVAWFITYGVWPKQHLLHSCDTPQCVRPDHLFEGTNLENRQDAARKGINPNLAQQRILLGCGLAVWHAGYV